MPAYDYICLSCAHSFEMQQSINDEPLSACPECGSSVRRVITGGSGFIMKGGKAAARATACGNDTPCCARGEACGGSQGCGF